jgi:transposase
MEVTALVARNRLLEEENRWLKQQLFGRSSEKTPPAEINPDQARLFNEAEALVNLSPQAPESIAIAAHERRNKPGRKPLSAELPRVEIVHDLPEDERVCAQDGTPLERIGEEVSEQLDYQPARLRVIRHVRPKYACPCCREGVKIAPVSPSVIPKSMASAALLACVVTAKFVDGLPLHRQETQFARLGVLLGRATMAGWLVRLGTLVQPLINLLAEAMMNSPVIHCDETRLQVLKSDKAPTADHWMWVRAAGPPGRKIVLFDYDASRGGQVPKRLLEDYRGVVLTDGYEPYAAVAQSLGFTHAGCMAHARRKFDEALKAQPTARLSERDGHAKTALAFIRELYQIERPLWDREKPVTAEDRVRVRAQLSRPVMERFHAWLSALAPQVLPESQLGKAVRYTLNQWSKLSVFLTRGEVPLDNNRCENAIRPFVLGRKNWLFANTVSGAKSSANLYSLVETAKANGLEPHAYLTTLFEKLPTLTTVEDFEALLPWNVKAAARSGSQCQ